MSDIRLLLNLQGLHDAKEKIDRINKDAIPLSELDISKHLFGGDISPKNKTVVAAHLHALGKQLNSILDASADDLKTDELYLEFSKGLTAFDRATGAIGLTDNTFGDQFIASQNIYLSAVSSYKRGVPNFYQGDLNLSLVPLKLRLAIEIYFKNMIGFSGAKSEVLRGEQKGRISNYQLKISEILSFFAHKKYRKYANIPAEMSIIQDINYWSNNLVHTGIISYPWQSLTAIDMLHPLFHTKRENGKLNLEGFNYLDLTHKQSDLISDMNKHLSKSRIKVEISCFKRTHRPIEGAYYYPSNP